MPNAFDDKLARELVKQVGLEPLFDKYLGSQEKHLCKCVCGASFFVVFSTITRKLKKNENVQILCQKCRNKSTKYSYEYVVELFKKHKAKPLFEKTFWENCIKKFSAREFGRIHLDYECICGAKDWTILENLIAKSNKNSDYVLYCHSCALKNGAQSRKKLEHTLALIKNYFDMYEITVENLNEIKNNTSKLIFKCKCGNLHQTTWMSVRQNKSEPKCAECQLRARPRGELHPNWNPNLSDKDRDPKDNKHTFHIWSLIVKKIYEFKCQISKQICNDLHTHHLMPAKFHPELKYDLANGLPIRRELHEKFHKLFGKHSDNYSDFLNFYKEMTGYDYKPISNIAAVIIDSAEIDLIKLKKEYYEKGVNFVPIFKWEVLGAKQNIITSIVKAKFGLISNKLNARDFVVRKALDKEKIRLFLQENHRQSDLSFDIAIELVDNKTNDLVAVMTFGAPRYFSEAEFELLRFCCKTNTIVRGAAQKMFSFFVNNFHPKSVISYADLRFASLDPNQSVYSNLNFKFIRLSPPNYWYTKNFINFESRYSCQKHKLKAKLPNFNEMLTEEENMLSNGFIKVSDCGNLVFLWKQEN